jgi:hypothetical protein
MSGMDGGDDGELPDAAVATIAEVAKQCKFLVATACRASLDECARMLGRLQLNGFEMTASKAEGASGGHRPVGIGVFPSASWTNHSCAPNCRQSFDSHGCIVVETARAVSKDEELTIPYVDTRLGRRERRERLRKNFRVRLRVRAMRRRGLMIAHRVRVVAVGTLLIEGSTSSSSRLRLIHAAHDRTARWRPAATMRCASWR